MGERGSFLSSQCRRVEKRVHKAEYSRAGAFLINAWNNPAKFQKNDRFRGHMIVGLSLLNKVIMKGGQMCWICERLENLITVWNEEREFQEQTSSDDYHRGLLKGFSECVKDLSDALSSMRMKGVCEKFTRHERSFDDEERLEILNDLLKLRNEDGKQE